MSNGHSLNTAHSANLALIAVYAGAAAIAFTIGLSAPMDRGRTYDLVMTTEGESDVLDYNLSALDCGALANTLQRAGHSVMCERAR